MGVMDSIPGLGSSGGDDADTGAEGDGADDEPDLTEETRPYRADSLQDLPDEWLTDYNPDRDGRTTDSLQQLHQNFVAPSDVEFEKNIARLGDKWVQSLFINEWPQQAKAGFLERLFKDSVYDTDVSLHLEPRDNRQAVDDLKDNIDEIQVKLEDQQEAGSVEARDTQLDLEDAQGMYDLVSRGGAKLVDCSMYVNHRGPTRQAVEDRANEVFSLLEKPPASTDPRVATRNQDRSITSASPIGMDMLNKKSAMMGGAIGAMMPFSSATLIEENGVDWGIMPYNRSPVIVDRFGRDTGYNVLVIGNIGSGKSFSTKLNLVRTILRRDDVDLIMLDPLEGFVGVTEALRGNRIRVGGDVGLNPLEIKETPVEIIEQRDADIDPYGSKIKDVMSFFETYFHIRDFSFGKWRGVLERAIREAYQDKGIIRDPSTHDKQSPLMPDVLDILGQMSHDAEEFTHSGSENEKKEFEDGASKLLVALEPFQEGGEFENLSRETRINISDSRVTYLDLQEQEGRGGMGMMMQLLFNAVYERAKQSNNKTIFVIDEARYIMKDSASLEFLEQAVRHSRHYDLSIQFITQTVDEFFAADEAEAIADNCSIKQLNRVEGLDEEYGIDKLDLNQTQVEFVRTATPGNEERDYSEALLQVQGEGWRPIHIRASDKEAAVVDFEPGEGESLPGPANTDDAQTARIHQALSASTEAEENVTDAGTSSRSFTEKMTGLGSLGDEGVDADDASGTAPANAGRSPNTTEAATSGTGGSENGGAPTGGDSRSLGEYSQEELLAEAERRDEVPEQVADNGGTSADTDADADTGTGTGSASAPVADGDLSLGSDADLGTGADSDDDTPGAYYLQVVVNTTENDDNGRMVINALEDAVEIVATDPIADEVRAGNFTIGFDAVVVSSIHVDEVRSALQSIDEVTSVDTDTLENAHERERAAEHFEGVTANDIQDQVENTSQTEGSEFFSGSGSDGLTVDQDALDNLSLGDDGGDGGEGDEDDEGDRQEPEAEANGGTEHADEE